MDDSWRLRMGMPATPHVSDYPSRRSAEEAPRRSVPCDDTLDPEDFSDVFGGPPRTVLSRQFSARGFPTWSSSTAFFYDEIFRPFEKTAPAEMKSGRSLPQFRIPGEQTRNRDQHRRETSRFYSDIFGWENDQQRVVRSRSRSKVSSSSVLSSEDLSPLPPVDFGDNISLFASKLRPINVESRWTSRRVGHEDHPQFASNQPIHKSEDDSIENLRTCHVRRDASSEAITLEPISNFKVSADNSELNSPSSAVSLVCLSDQEQKTDDDIDDHILRQDAKEQEVEDEAMSSYIIEIKSDNREGACEDNGIDEAIAWAKEKFQAHSPVQECEKEKPAEEIPKDHQLSEDHTDRFGSADQGKWIVEEGTAQLESVMQSEMQMIDEKISLWSKGNEGNIRLLLSSLHNILWPSSGWLAIPLTDIIEIWKVKKAYQRARLCLHPDKLQQRGATLPQKYIAGRAFSILQDAWDSFISSQMSSVGERLHLSGQDCCSGSKFTGEICSQNIKRSNSCAANKCDVSVHESLQYHFTRSSC